MENKVNALNPLFIANPLNDNSFFFKKFIQEGGFRRGELCIFGALQREVKTNLNGLNVTKETGELGSNEKKEMFNQCFSLYNKDTVLPTDGIKND